MTSGFVTLTKLNPDIGGRVAILADDIRHVEEVPEHQAESYRSPGTFCVVPTHCKVIALDAEGRRNAFSVRESFDDVMRAWDMARNERVISSREGSGA